MPWVPRLEANAQRASVVDADGVVSYAELLSASATGARALLGPAGDLEGERVGLLAPPGREWVVAFLSIWRAGAIAVPMSPSHPELEWIHLLDDARPSAWVVHPSMVERVRGPAAGRGVPVVPTNSLFGSERADLDAPHGPGIETVPPPLPRFGIDRAALMLYTSGTSGRPKGAVATHGNVIAWIEAMATAWGWSANDRILHVLPLHHVHGIVNALLTSLWSGACCEMRRGFEAREVWERLASGEPTLFMAVPTIYRRLIRAWEATDEETRNRWSEGAARLRLMVSGSAALPVPTIERWEEITGHRLLERYGMTEIGMALTNPLVGERRPGFVGRPFPGVEARIVDDSGAPVRPGTPGELEVRGPGVFQGYWDATEATEAAFRNGWFRTGDEAVTENEDYRILGRRSIDIVKTGGFKVSTIEVENVLRDHPDIGEIAVVGLPDPDWGERLCAVVVPSKRTNKAGPEPGDTPPVDPSSQESAGEIELADLRAWAKKRLAPYKVPTDLRLLDALPLNAMGKVVKMDLRKLFETGASQ